MTGVEPDGTVTECWEISPAGYACTRTADHRGTWHIAHTDEVRNGRRVEIDRWRVAA